MNMLREKLGVLINGAGSISTDHIKAYQNNPHTKVVAISSRRLSSAITKAKDTGVKDAKFYDDFEKALDQPDVNVVSVCTPPHIHADNVIKAAEAHKHIVIEKPIAISLEEVIQMRRAVKKAGVKTVVSFVLRWSPFFEALKRMISDDFIGDIYFVKASYQFSIPSRYPGWSGWSWARRKDTEVSAFLWGGCHAVDAVRWLANKDQYGAAEAKEVFAYSGGYRKGREKIYDYKTSSWKKDNGALEWDDLEVALVKFKNGALGSVSVNASCIMPYNLPIEIFGDKGTIKDNRIWSHNFPGQRDWVVIPTILPGARSRGEVRTTYNPFQGEIDHFVNCILEDKESHCNLEDAIKTHEIIFAALRCYKERVPVELPLLK